MIYDLYVVFNLTSGVLVRVFMSVITSGLTLTKTSSSFDIRVIMTSQSELEACLPFLCYEVI